jgi:hypothetical protein
MRYYEGLFINTIPGPDVKDFGDIKYKQLEGLEVDNMTALGHIAACQKEVSSALNRTILVWPIWCANCCITSSSTGSRLKCLSPLFVEGKYRSMDIMKIYIKRE